MKTPDFFIVGAPKCGTTAMYDYLKQHPEVFMPEAKEPHFFGSDLFSPLYIRDEKEYLSLFSRARNEKRVGEASTWYLYSKRAAMEIKQFNSSASIIIMLRNPVDMIYSMHSQLLYYGHEDIVDFEAALEAEDDRKQGLRLPDSSFLVESLYYREAIKYTEQVQRYLDVFGWDKVLIIIFDDFKNDTTQVYQEACEFLGVDPQFEPEIRPINPNKIARNKTFRNFLTNPSPVTRVLARILMPLAMRRTFAGTLMRLNTEYKPRPAMPLQLRHRLQAEFAPEVEQLSKLLGRDLTHWCYT